MSSALWPVAILCTPSRVAPRSRACRRNTPQNVQLFFSPTRATIASIVHPYSSSNDTTFRGIRYCASFRFTVASESSRYPLMPSSMDRSTRSSP